MTKRLAGKNILVTGADGFIGSHLVEALLTEGANITALAQYNSFNNWGWLEAIDCSKLKIITGDIRDTHFCTTISKDMDIIFHLAALIAIPFSYTAPDLYIDTNVKGTLNMLQAARTNGCSRLIHTSTSEVYGTAKYVPIDEKHPLQPQSPYSASKIGADSIAMSFFHAFELPVTIARPFNTYGPRQSARAVIPTIISQINKGETNIQLGDLTPTRDFTYVKDTCEGFISLATNDNTIGEIVNIGSNTEISIQDLLIVIKDLMQVEVNVASDSKRLRPKGSEVFRLYCDNSKIKGLTGFQIQYDLHKGIKETIDWFSKRDNLAKYKSGIYNV